jgi:hypothetical protein
MTTINASSTINILTDTTYSADSGPTLTISSWPVTIVNTAAGSNTSLDVNFAPGITYASTTNYFICGSDKITFDGQNNPINVSVDNWLGLIQNGTSGNNGKNQIVVKNIGIISTNTIVSDAGWVCQRYFGFGISSRNNEIQNCYSTGTIGTIGSFESAGISGSDTANSTISNCYSNGNIPGNYAAGICGSRCSNLNIVNCYSLGVFSGIQGTETFCGICGQDCRDRIYITNCYVLNAMQVYGPRSTPVITNCYTANGSWSDSDANAALTNTPTSIYNAGSIWTSIIVNTPYVLSQFTTVNSYSPNNWEQSSGSSYTTGQITLFSNPPYSYNLLSVNNDIPSNSNATFNNSTGVITFSSLTYATTQQYKANVFISQGTSPNYFGYTFSQFTLTTLNLPQEIAANYKILITSTGDYVDDSNTPQPLPSFPITIINESPSTGTLVVSFAPGITYSSTSNYFICGSDNITFDGSYNVISVSGITDWPGFIQNGTISSNGFNNITVQNVFISSGTSTLDSGAGWVTQQYFGKSATNNKVINTGVNLIGI